ncbi:hypothetical protein [Cyanobium gracile]|uniref:Uncharacterized protein n=1 Tax=Cyanobium gracile (strain ATCC 27147 / PCC 6307) TaxID=292564 RepID=K9P464_CYAGP|nr:hypothetical protein [Cyanobium gracile]AFY27788.1 hypothetical protein Cyagr_0597 [Cyanobium gracile PCC 6307]
MEFQPITTALSRALALRLDPGTTYLGGGLQLTISPSAQASNRVVLPALQPIGSVATALGLGLGASRFLTGPDNAAFFNSPGLSVVTGGGSIGGTAAATATTTGRNANSADATAVNIGLAQLDVVTRGGGALNIGTPANPFGATASAASRSLLAAQPDPVLTAQLSALATARGLEGAAQSLGPLPTFFGQPNAAVLAAADLDLDPGPATTSARAVADAKGIEGYRVMALAPGPSAPPDAFARVSGSATASVGLAGAPPTAAQPADLTATAIGIDQAALRGPASGSVLFQGSGLALLNAPAVLPPGALNLQSLQGIGIAGSDIQTNGGPAAVVGIGGFAAPNSGGLLPGMDAAGIDGSTIYAGAGNLTVMGSILTEQQAGVDANGDGVIAADVFLDASALTGGQGGFDGIRNSTIITGPGTASVLGSSNDSTIALSRGSIQLDRAKDSTLSVNDGSITVTGLAFENSLKGGFGNNVVQVAGGSGNRLDGGFGQDVVIAPSGGAGSNTLLQSNAGAALAAASRQAPPGGTSGFAERLTDPSFWAGLGAQQKQTLWETGSLVLGAQTFTADSFRNFEASRGDVLELSSSLGSLTQSLWDSQGALFGVQNGQLVVRDGPANSQLGVVVGTLADIRSLGIGSPSLAYATDTRQLMFDADGDWSKGSQSLGTVSIANPAALTKANIHFGSGS